MTCLRRPPHSPDEQARALVVLGVRTLGDCPRCFLDGDDPPPEEPCPNWGLAPDGPFFEALAQAYRLAGARDRAALRYAYPNLGALIMLRGGR